MRRREFISLIGLGAVARPLMAHAQAAKPVIGYLSSKDERAEAGIIAGMRKGLAALKLSEGSDFTIEFRFSAGAYDELPRLAADLVARRVDVIAASGLPAALVAQKATSSIPVVFRLAVDPVAFKLVQSFDRPGGHITGVTMLFDPLTPKKLEVLHELVSGNSIGLLVNPKNPNYASHIDHAERAMKQLGLRLSVFRAATGDEIGSAVGDAKRKSMDALLVGDDPLFDVQNQTLADETIRHKIPTMFYVRDFVKTGGLISYGPSFDEMAEQVGLYCGRIIKGAKPDELPVQQPTKFELVINLKTARALGLTIPPTMMARADEIIE